MCYMNVRYNLDSVWPAEINVGDFREIFWDGINDTPRGVYLLWSITMGFVKNDKLFIFLQREGNNISKIYKPYIIFYERPVVGYKYNKSDTFIKSIIPT